MRLALVVPALNEEEAIAGTLRRALASRAKVLSQTGLDGMYVVFVNDGSTDRTQEIVDQPEFSEVVKVRFPQNRGYGAAIKAGWKATDAELVGFIDGDGTCDPDFCVPLVRRLFETNADVVLAGRLNPQSRMPWVRKLGNSFFARLLSLLSGRSLSDAASGFRIVRRSSLRLILPLPDRLHFTPAMSCVCLFDRRLRIEEVPMPYEERIGQSKLSVVRDGLRFLFTILFASFFHAPLRTAGVGALLSAVIYGALLLLARQSGHAALLARGLGCLGCAQILLLLTLGLLQHQIGALLLDRAEGSSGRKAPARAVLPNEPMLGGGLILGTLSLAGLAGLMFAGAGDSRPLLALSLAALVLLGLWTFLGGLCLRAVWMAGEKLRALHEDEFRSGPGPEVPPRP